MLKLFFRVQEYGIYLLSCFAGGVTATLLWVSQGCCCVRHSAIAVGVAATLL
jgi:hypothetical protein